MKNPSNSPIIKLAEAHETMAEALRGIVEMGITVPKKAVEVEEEVKTITLEDVRAVLAEKSRSGHTAEIKKILATYGADKLSEVKPDDYQAVLNAVEGLGDD